MTGLQAHRVLASLPDARRIGRGWTRGKLLDLRDFPGLVPSRRPGDRVFGELWEVGDSKNALTALDKYEEFNPRDPDHSLYVRRNATVRLPTGASRAWVYVLRAPPADARVVEGGDWRTSRTLRNAAVAAEEFPSYR